MKNRIGIAIAYVLLGVLLILIPVKLFPVCNYTEMKMACYYTQRSIVGVGIIVAILGAVTVFFADSNIRIGISISQIGLAALIFLYSTKLIGLCKMSTMQCRLGTGPALFVAGIVIAGLSVINAIYLYFKNKKVKS